MTILTDDPDWELYEARALAIRFARKYGRWQPSAGTCRVAERRGLRVTYHPQRSPRRLTIDSAGESAGTFECVLGIEWNERDAWRMTIETYRPGRWESRLRQSFIRSHGYSAGGHWRCSPRQREKQIRLPR